MTRRMVCWSVPALLLLPCLCSCAESLGAPAPKAQKAKPLTMLGDFTESWRGTEYAAWFRDDATCGATGAGERWRGTWNLRGRKLYVTEQCGEAWLTWDADLDEKLSGTAVIRASACEDNVGKQIKVTFSKR